MYDLKEKRRIDEMIDYDIIFNNNIIGVLNLNIYSEKIFIRQLRINKEYQRKNHATRILEYLFESFKRNIGFCVATNSESAIAFWKIILNKKEHIHIRGEIYELIFN